jgi:hypothetical protein
LSKYFPPEIGVKAKCYAEELQTYFPQVGYIQSSGGRASNPSNSKTLLLPGAQWQEAFFIAQQLFDIPKEFHFPNPKGKDKQVVQFTKSQDKGWKNQLEVTRKNNQLTKIEYRYESQKFDRTIRIEEKGATMKISETETIN